MSEFVLGFLASITVLLVVIVPFLWVTEKVLGWYDTWREKRMIERWKREGRI